MEKEGYIIEKVENGFLFTQNGKTYVFESIEALAKDLANGVLSRIPVGGKLEFSAKILSDGRKNNN